MSDYKHDFLAFFRDKYVVEGAYGPRPIIPPFLEVWLHTAFPLPSGDPAARNIGDFRTKKQGKSALAGAVALYMATRQPNAEVIIAASDIDQAKDRVLRAVKYAVEHGPLAGHAKVYRDMIELDNGSFIQAIPADWKGAAGGNPCTVIFDELHAWTFESQRRLFDELVIPPTVKAGMRWMASYAGWTAESMLLEELWTKGLVGKQNKDLPIYLNDDASLLAFIDTGPESWRMPWMTNEYIKQTQATERPNTFKRLWLNEWVSGEGEFLPVGAWEACFDRDLRPVRPDEKLRLVLGIDASTSGDHSGIVGTIWNNETGTVDVKFVKEWIPKKGFLRGGKPTIDLARTVGAEVQRLYDAGQIAAIVADVYQLHALLIEWERQGIKVIELPQSSGRVASDSGLLQLATSGMLRHYGDKTLTQHINNCATIEGPRGLRIAKRSGSMKIDLAVCLSMSTWGAQNSKADPGGMEIIPVDMFDGENHKMRKINGVWLDMLTMPGWTEDPHPLGVNYTNCKKRNGGCAACMAELKAIGYFDQEAEKVSSGYYQSNAEAVRQAGQPFNNSEGESHEHIDLFWKSVRDGLARHD